MEINLCYVNFTESYFSQLIFSTQFFSVLALEFHDTTLSITRMPIAWKQNINQIYLLDKLN